eukprot:TRINITY_DN9321_c0_g1_i2.p1 TRINITY_DN9321_c0_g1~~TRINITY_DN9321_c0_g1_i2.p1  ORF type:complete len:161 (-),score=27.29 TRINITY_DN9321_c0_g1_i2:48-530(-)
MGGGWGLLFTTDIRLAVRSAEFSFSEVKRGIVPAIISAYVVPQLGPFHAKQLFLTGEKISAEKAQEIGFLSGVVDTEEELDRETLRYVRVVLGNGPGAMSHVKSAVQFVSTHAHPENLRYVQELFDAAVVTSPEALYGMACFMQKAQPDWTQFLREQAKL